MLKRNSAAETEIKTTPRLMLINRRHHESGKKSGEGSEDLHPYSNHANEQIGGKANQTTGNTTVYDHHFQTNRDSTSIESTKAQKNGFTFKRRTKLKGMAVNYKFMKDGNKEHKLRQNRVTQNSKHRDQIKD